MSDISVTNPRVVNEDIEILTRAGYREEAPAGYTIAQRSLAEFVGTFALVFIGAGSIAAAAAAGGGTAGAGLVTIAIAHGLAIATMVSAVGHISGAHLNPAVTFGALLCRKIALRDAGVYFLSQVAGAVVAAEALRLIIAESVWRSVKLGTPLLAENVTPVQGVVIEAILAFILVWVVFATAVDSEGAFGKIAGLAIGFVVLMDIMMGGPFTGGAMNPARSFGPALVGGYWADAWLYWVGPLAGGAAAAVLYDRAILRPRRG